MNSIYSNTKQNTATKSSNYNKFVNFFTYRDDLRTEELNGIGGDVGGARSVCEII